MPSTRESTLFQDERISMSREQDGRLIRIRRTSVPSTPEWLDVVGPRIEALIQRAERARLVILFDTRDAPMVSEPVMEAKQRAITERMMDGYRKRAVLVRTAIGRLQIGRFNRERAERREGPPIAVFDDEAAAITFLLS